MFFTESSTVTSGLEGAVKTFPHNCSPVEQSIIGIAGDVYQGDTVTRQIPSESNNLPENVSVHKIAGQLVSKCGL